MASFACVERMAKEDQGLWLVSAPRVREVNNVGHRNLSASMPFFIEMKI